MDSELQTNIRQLAQTAGEKILEFRPSVGDADNSNLDIKQKKDGSLVSKADMLSNAILSNGIKSLCPEDLIYSEEEPLEFNSDQAGRIWIIDPLDGTSHFLEGKDDFSIQIALCENHKIVFGLMHFPAKEIFLSANKEEGGTTNDIPLRVSSDTRLRPGTVYCRGFEPTPSEYFCREGLDSGFALLQLASGKLSGAILNMEHFGEYDIAAATCAIIEAGGRVTNEHDEELTFCRSKPNYKFFVASNSKVHKDILSIATSH